MSARRVRAACTAIAMLHAIPAVAQVKFCKQPFPGGETRSGIKVEVCLIETSSPTAQNGDLIVHVTNLDATSKKVDVEGCVTKYTPPLSFTPITLSSGGLMFYLDAAKTTGSYIIEPNLDAGKRHAWKSFSSQSCEWNVEKKDPQSGWELFDVIRAVPQ